MHDWQKTKPKLNALHFLYRIFIFATDQNKKINNNLLFSHLINERVYVCYFKLHNGIKYFVRSNVIPCESSINVPILDVGGI